MTPQEQQAFDRADLLALYKPPFKHLYGYIFDADNHNMVADGPVVNEAAMLRVRGWGRLQQWPNGAALQDAVGDLIAEALTQYWDAAAKAVSEQPQARKPLTNEQIDRVALEEIGFGGEHTQALNIEDIRLIVRAVEAALRK